MNKRADKRATARMTLLALMGVSVLARCTGRRDRRSHRFSAACVTESGTPSRSFPSSLDRRLSSS